MMQNIRLKCLSLILIISLIPKLGLEMYMHRLLHQPKTFAAASHSNSPQLNQSCTCVEDAFMPLDATTPVVIIAPEKECTILFSTNIYALFSTSKDFSFLRGPPFA